MTRTEYTRRIAELEAEVAALRDRIMETRGPALLELSIPLRTTTGLNNREHHYARARRVLQERRAVAMAVGVGEAYAAREVARAAGPLLVTLTRVGRGDPDDDNVVGGLKAVRDELAAWLGIDDGSKRIRWQYRTERGPYAVRVLVERRG